MKINRLVIKELSFRKINFLLLLIAASVAVAAFVGTHSSMKVFDVTTEEIILQKEAETKESMLKLEDDYRVIMKRLGYNALIIHKNEDISNLRTRGYPTLFMPEEGAVKLGKSGTKRLNHLLPFIQTSIYWPEQQRNIIVSGIKHQVPVSAKKFHIDEEGGYKDPITPPLQAGTTNIGYEIANKMKLSEGSAIKIKGEEFVVNTVYPQRGNDDDLTLWLPIDRVQQWLGKQGQINGIFALQCVCQGTEDLLLTIKKEVAAVLPDAQVIGFGSIAAVRQDARKRASVAHKAAMEAELKNRAELRKAREQLFSIAVPSIIAISVILITVLSFLNVRERHLEIATLRALGFRSKQIFYIFLSRAFLVGILGGFIGYLIGVFIGVLAGRASPFGVVLSSIFSVKLFVGVLLLAPCVTIFTSWVPALNASMKDPATILRED
ncbi:FtsX-like permease family protein [bacterium]|nr:FtsX-like permease family protein [bacterium]